MNNLFGIQTDFAPALLSVLIHSLWIGGLLYLVLRLYLDTYLRHPSVSRYFFSVATLAGQAALTIMVFILIYQPDRRYMETTNIDIFNISFLHNLRSTGIAPGVGKSLGLVDIALLIYLAGVVFFFLRMLISSLIIRNKISRSDAATLQYARLLDRTRSRLGIRKSVRMVISDQLRSPALFGFFKPVIIVPAGMITHLTFDQVEVILVHELIHLKKADFLVNLFQQLVESLLFFNPFTWMISRLVREEREKRIDDTVTQQFNAQIYARALFNLSLVQTESSAALLAAGGGGQKLLLNRIQRILKVNKMKKAIKTRFYIAALGVVGMLMVLTLSGFNSSLLHFDKGQTKPVTETQQSVSQPGNAPVYEQDEASNDRNIAAQAAITGSSIQTAGAKTDRRIEATITKIEAGIEQDTLTEEERKELLRKLEAAKQELESIDWEQEMALLEEERARLLKELPEKIAAERVRVQEELQKIDAEQIRKQMEQAKRQLDSVREQLDMKELQQQLQYQQQQIDAQLHSEELDEMTRQALEKALVAIKETDLEGLMADMEHALSDIDLDINIDIAHDYDLDIQLDSMMIEVQEHLKQVDIESIKRDVDQSVREIENQIEELKSSESAKNQKK